MSDAGETVELSPYSPMWPAVFDIERDRLLAIFGPDGVIVEHVGSTAVPGLGAKPIIDVLLGAASLLVVERHIPDLVASGYTYVPEFEKALPDRRYFNKRHGQPGHFHLHAVVYDTPFWKRTLAFRDALRRDESLAAEYWKVKRRLAARFPNDRGAYTDAKSDFIRTVLEGTR